MPLTIKKQKKKKKSSMKSCAGLQEGQRRTQRELEREVEILHTVLLPHTWLSATCSVCACLIVGFESFQKVLIQPPGEESFTSQIMGLSKGKIKHFQCKWNTKAD